MSRVLTSALVLVFVALTAARVERPPLRVDSGECLHACKSFTETKVPGCTLNGDGCKCLIHSSYRVQFTDPTTQVSFESGWTDETDAGNQAIVGLFQQDNGCNCHGNTSIPVGGCTVSAQVCFFFGSTDLLTANAPSFRVFAQVVAPTASPQYTTTAANSTDLAVAAYTIGAEITSFNPACAISQSAGDVVADAISRMALY
jgi:hypothetical protein